MTPEKRLRLAVMVLLLLPLAALLLVRPLDDRLGLTGTYYSRVDWSGARFSRVDYQIATEALAPAIGYAGNRPFAVTWQGFLAVDHPGIYRFEIVSDDGSTVRIDDRWLINISGTHGPLAARGARHLDAGLHPIQIDFYEAGGGWKIDLFWAQGDGEFVRVPPAVLLHRPVSLAEYRVLTRLSTLAGLAPLCWITAALLMAANWGKRWMTLLAAHLRWSPLLAVLLVSLLVNVLGIWWGFPDGWAADEVGPRDVVGGMTEWFSGGWYSKYPMIHYYILSLVSMPFLIADLLRPSDPNAQGMFGTLFIVHRLVSVAMATGTIIASYFCGLRLSGRVAGLFAAMVAATVLPFVYYSKVVNLDVPYLFWFAVSMLAYIVIIQGGARAAY